MKFLHRMAPHEKRRLIYAAGIAFCVVVIGSVVADARWVFRVFLFFNDRSIRLDTNYDGRPDYFERWEDGELVFSEWDTNFDGNIDYRNRFAEGVIRELEVDADFNGYFEYREVTADGKTVVELDEDEDGTFASFVLENR